MNATSRITQILSVLGLAVAVFVVGMAGSATAAKLVTGADIKNNSVTTQDIKNATITGKDLGNGKVSEKKLTSAARAKLNAPAVAGYEVVSTTVEVATASADTAFVACTPGKVALGGGGSFETTEFSAVIQESAPQRQVGDFFAPAEADLADAWKVTGSHNGLDPVGLTAWVICVDPS